jgi:hypothetical protein
MNDDKQPYFLTNFMEYSPSWQTDSRLAGQEFPRVLWNPNFQYRVHKN